MAESFESKSLALLRILNVLERYSDSNHPLTQQQIIEYLEKDYGITIERKNVGRKISALKEALEKDGIYIESTKTGTYLDTRAIEDSELRMLIDGVLSSKYITAKHSKDLIEKLCKLSNKYFKSHVKNIYSVNDWGKTDNQELFLNIEIVDEAIERGRQISFTYNKYRIDKKLHKSASHIASPYQLILHNQRYFLMAFNEKQGNMGHYRLDHITDMQIIEDSTATDLRSIEGFKNGIDYKDLALARPYMFTDKAESVTFICEWWVMDQVIDWFGTDVRMEYTEDDKVKVTLRVSPNAMEYWAMQYLNVVEIIAPESLRDRIKQNIAKAATKYGR